jgi:hypothetical protein
MDYQQAIHPSHDSKRSRKPAFLLLIPLNHLLRLYKQKLLTDQAQLKRELLLKPSSLDNRQVLVEQLP